MTAGLPGGHRPRRAALHEREPELGALLGVLAAAAGGRGGTVLVQGEAGIGKSRLLSETRGAAAVGGMTVLAASGGELERSYAFGVARQLLADAPAPAGATDAVLHALYWRIAELAERAPVLVCVDDLQWVDEPSLRFLVYLARRLEDLPVALVLGHRTGERERQLVRALLVAVEGPVLTPAPLSAAAVEQLVRDAVGAKAAAALGPSCHAATRGNPFLLGEVLRVLTPDADPDAVASLASDRVVASILLRLAAVDAAAPTFALALAVLGNSATPTAAARLADLDPAAVPRLIDALTAIGVLEADGAPRFVHPLVRAAVYDAAPGAQRSALHARAAVLLAEEGRPHDAVATQLLAAAPAGDPHAVALLRAAAADASARGAPDAAARYLRRALDEPPAADVRPAVLLALGAAQLRAGDPAALDALRGAWRAATDPAERRAAALQLGFALAVGCTEIAEAVAVLDDALSDDAGAALPLAVLMLVAMSDPEARRRMDARVADARRRVATLPPDEAMLVLSPLAADLAVSGGAAGDVAALARRALAGGRLMRRDIEDESGLALPAVWALVQAGQMSQAQRAIDEGLAHARHRGSPLAVARVSAFRSLVAYRAGDLRAAEADALACLDLVEGGTWDVPFATAVAVLAAVRTERGDLDGAEAALGRLEPVPAPVTPSRMLHEVRARLWLARGAPDAALDELAPCAEWELRPAVVPVAWRSAAALAHAALGDAEAAAAAARDEVALARAFGAAPQLGGALRALGLVTHDAEPLREAVAVLGASEARLEHARALVALGAVLRRAGRRDDAVAALRDGMDRAHRCGADALVAAARDDLRLAGARPRRIAVTGRQALTPRERQVVELAAEGLTNKQLAQALFVTLRTVEMHLSNAYRKLGITSRDQLT